MSTNNPPTALDDMKQYTTSASFKEMTRYAKLHEPIHRLLTPLTNSDFVREKQNGIWVLKVYGENDRPENIFGASVFLPTEPTHGFYSSTAAPQNLSCAFVPKISMPVGFGLLYTGVEQYEHLPVPATLNDVEDEDDIDPAGIIDTGSSLGTEFTGTVHHFLLFPTSDLPSEDRQLLRQKPKAFEEKIRNSFDWFLCSMKAAGEETRLINRYQDLDHVHDRLIRHLYQLSAISFAQSDNLVDQFWANAIHTWIAIHKPTWKDLVADSCKAQRIFVMCSEIEEIEDDHQLNGSREKIVAKLQSEFGWEDIVNSEEEG